MKCSRGMTYRKSYTRKGKRVAGQCVRSQTQSHIRMRGFRHSRRALRTCPQGYIKRTSYVRYTKKGKHVLVPEQCIRDVGAPGKGFAKGHGIGPLRKGELTKFGYENVVKLSESERHAALTKAVAEYGSLGVWRKLNAVSVYTRRISPASSKVFKADMDWIRAKFGIKAL